MSTSVQPERLRYCRWTALPDLELALPWNRCRVRQSRLLFPSHAAERLHSCVSPFRFSLRVQGALAALVWALALSGGAIGRRL
jgi:hypothetical protein